MNCNSVLSSRLLPSNSILRVFRHSFHLGSVVYNSDLEIVVTSIVGNWKRLGSVALFLIMIMFWYGMSGLLYFENIEGNTNSRCRTLLECFVSYSFRGLSGDSLSSYIPAHEFPQQFDDIYGDIQTLRLLWELAFTLLTVSMLGAIITGMTRP